MVGVAIDVVRIGAVRGVLFYRRLGARAATVGGWCFTPPRPVALAGLDDCDSAVHLAPSQCVLAFVAAVCRV